MAIDPAEILKDVSPENVPLDSPPDAADYRPADIAGVCCAFCAKFCMTGMRDSEDESGIVTPIPTGICEQWEAKVDGVSVCDRFASGAPHYDESGNELWEFADQHKSFSEIHFSPETEVKREGESNFVIKEIMRTGEWPVIPTKGGVIKRPLKIVRNGRSSAEEGVISLSEIVENFKAGVIPNPQVPLTDEQKQDHKNLIRLNTGFVRDLWIVDEGEEAKLVSRMEITEPDVLTKILHKTYSDVSCGIPWRVVSRGKEYGTCLEHVALTNKPFIDGLGPFLAASDDNDGEVEVNHFALPSPSPDVEENQLPSLSYEWIREKLNSDIRVLLNLPSHYVVKDINAWDRTAVIYSELANQSWVAPYNVDSTEDGNSVTLKEVSNWTLIEEEKEGENNNEAPVQENRTAPRRSSDDELEAAYRLREIHAGETQSSERSDMSVPVTQEELDRLEMSDEQRAFVQGLLDENSKNAKKARESEANKRIDELEAMGLKERPGALKLYRDVMLSDDGGPAIVLLSDDGNEKERVGAQDLLDRFLDALKGEDGMVNLSDQHLVSDSNRKPPANSENEEADEETRTRNAREALYGGTKRRRSMKGGEK